MTRLDVLATEPHFVDHMAPVWHALPADLRGDVIVPTRLRDRARRRGLPASPAADHPTRPVLVASYGDNKRARRLGRTRIAYIEHGAGQSYAGDRKHDANQSYAGGGDRADVGLFLVPNEPCAARWRAAYPGVPVEVIGCPRLDALPALSGPPGVVCISFHWTAESAIQETRGTFTYYRDVLASLRDRFELIGHGHPRALDGPPRLRREYARLGIPLVEDFEDVCRQASVYVFDNSSSGFEFAATGRPVVVMNEPVGKWVDRGYRLDMNHGLRFEPSDACAITSGRHFCSASHVGLNVWKPAELGDAIELALDDKEATRTAREAALALVYPYRSGAAQRAADALVAWSGERVAVAA